MKFFTQRGCSHTTTAEREIARDIKEMWCYIALDGYTERKSTAEIIDKEKTHKGSRRHRHYIVEGRLVLRRRRSRRMSSPSRCKTPCQEKRSAP